MPSTSSLYGIGFPTLTTILPENGSRLTSSVPVIPTGRIAHFVIFANPANPLVTPEIVPGNPLVP